MSTPPPGPLPPNTNRGPNLLASFWVPFPFTVAVLAARFYVRIRRRALGADDWAMLMAWILYAIALCLGTEIVRLGGVRHIEYLPLANAPLILKLDYVDQPFGIFALVFGKASVSLLLLRLLDNTAMFRRWFIYVNNILYFIISVTSVAIIFGQCSPSKALWNPALIATGQATCWNKHVNTDFSILQGSFGAYLDFVLAALPITIVYKLQMPLQRKLALGILLSLGVFAGICACIKTAQFTKAIDTTDPTWGAFALYLWASLEIPFVIIGGCIPAAKPLWDRLVEGKPLLPSDASGSGSRKSGSGRSYKHLTAKDKTAASGGSKSSGRTGGTMSTEVSTMASHGYDEGMPRAQWGGTDVALGGFDKTVYKQQQPTQMV